MEFQCQQVAIEHLAILAKSDKHSILISGRTGSGKTYLAKQYADLLNISDNFQVVAPKVAEVRQCIEDCSFLSHKVVVCIENLDIGVPGASHALLKFLEEPSPNVYIVVTARNLSDVLPTIISRSAVVDIGLPTQSDLEMYATQMNSTKFNQYKSTLLWKCVKNLQDVEILLKLNSDQLEYYASLSETIKFKDSVSNLIWKISHYPDNSNTPIEYVIRYIIELTASQHVKNAGIECIRSLSQGRIASHAILAKFMFEAKYVE